MQVILINSFANSSLKDILLHHQLYAHELVDWSFALSPLLGKDGAANGRLFVIPRSRQWPDCNKEHSHNFIVVYRRVTLELFQVVNFSAMAVFGVVNWVISPLCINQISFHSYRIYRFCRVNQAYSVLS